MALTALGIKVKSRVGIPTSNTDFDSDLEEMVEESIAELFPVVQVELDAETILLTADENTIDLSAVSADITSVRELELQDGSTGKFHPYEGFTQHGDILKLDADWDSTVSFKLWPMGRYTEATLTPELEKVPLNWAMAEFYSMLVGNARKYNLYTQASGARKTDNMRDTSDYYWGRGNQILIDRAKVAGAQ